jgi:hypothetical protein
MINAFWQPVVFHIQQGTPWTRMVDTSQRGIVQERLTSADYEVAARSVVVLEST